MNAFRQVWIPLLILSVSLVACRPGGPPAAPADIDGWGTLAWADLEPRTSSGDLANWQLIEVEQLRGADAAGQFEGEIAPGCWRGPTPQPNQTIHAAQSYWLVHMRPKPATAEPWPHDGTPPATAPPMIPEPFLREAFYLMNEDGHIIARKFVCVIY